MGIIPSRNLEQQRREENGIVYFDRGRLTGRNGRQYDRYAIQTHFVEVGEDQAELVRRYVLPGLAIVGSLFMILACLIGHGIANLWYLIVFAFVMLIGAYFDRHNK